MRRPALALALALGVGCSPGPSVVLARDEPGVFVLARLPDGVTLEHVELVSDDGTIELDVAEGLVAAAFVPLAGRARPDGSALPLEALEGARARALTQPVDPGFGACGRCLVPSAGAHALVFDGDSCPLPAAPRLFSLDEGGEPVEDPQRARDVGAQLRLEWRGACPEASIAPEETRVLEACPLWPEGPLFSTIALSGGGVAAGVAWDRVVIVGIEGDHEEIALPVRDRRAQIGVAREDGARVSFWVAAEQGESFGFARVDWDGARPRGQRASAVPVDHAPVWLGANGTFAADGRIVLVGRSDAAALVECSLDDAVARCDALTLAFGACARPSRMVAYAETASRGVVLGSHGELYLREGGSARCAGALELPGYAVSDGDIIAIHDELVVACVELEAANDGALSRAIVRARLGADDRAVEPAIVELLGVEGCESATELDDGIRVFTGAGAAIDVTASGHTRHRFGAPGPLADADRPIAAQLLRDGRELRMGIDGALFRGPAGGLSTRVLGAGRFVPETVRALGEAADGTQLVAHPREGLLALEELGSACPRLRALGVAPARPVVALAPDSRAPRRVAVATATGTRGAVELIELDTGATSPLAPLGEPGSALRALVELAPGLYVGVDEGGRAVQLDARGVRPVPFEHDDPSTDEPERAPEGLAWTELSGGSGVAWLGAKEALGRVLVTPDGAVGEGYWLTRLIIPSITEDVGANPEFEVEALASLAPGHLALALAKDQALGGEKDLLFSVVATDHGLSAELLSYVSSHGRIHGIAGARGTVMVRESSLVGLDRKEVSGVPGAVSVGRARRHTLLGQQFGHVTALRTEP